MGENDDNTILAPSNFSKVWAHPPFLRPNAQMIFKSPSKIHFLYSFRAQTPVISYFRPLPQKFTQHPLTFFQNHPLTLAFTYIFPESSTHSSIHIHFPELSSCILPAPAPYIFLYFKIALYHSLYLQDIYRVLHCLECRN